VTRILGPEGKGLYFLAISLSTLCLIVVKSSIEVSGTYFVGKKGRKIQELPGHYLFSTILVTAITYLVLGILWPSIHTTLFPGLPAIYAIIALTALPSSLIILYFASILMIPNLVGKYNRLFLVQGAITTLLLFLLTIVVRGGVLGALIAWSVGLALTAIYVIIVVHYQIQPSYKVSKHFLVQLFTFGLKGHMGEIADYFIDRTDALLINYFLGAVNVGYYAAALTAELLWYIPNSIIAILYPKFSHDTGDTLALAKQACRITLFVTVIPGIGLMILAKPLILLAFGSVFLPAVWPMIIAVPGVVSLSVSKCLKIFLSSQGLPLPASYASFIAFAFNLILNIIFIPRYGLVAAAIIGSLSYIIYAAAIFIQFSWRFKASLRETILIKSEDFRLMKRLLLSKSAS
ncbi:MAG: oligosaccharide flippase family protein, partial [Patescibacteria group bacterium]